MSTVVLVITNLAVKEVRRYCPRVLLSMPVISDRPHYHNRGKLLIFQNTFLPAVRNRVFVRVSCTLLEHLFSCVPKLGCSKLCLCFLVVVLVQWRSAKTRQDRQWTVQALICLGLMAAAWLIYNIFSWWDRSKVSQWDQFIDKISKLEFVWAWWKQLGSFTGFQQESDSGCRHK